MAVERDDVPIQRQRLGPIAGLNFAERQMPAQMAVEKSIARIAGEPGGQVGACRVPLAALVADMREPVRAMRVVRVLHHRSLDLRPGGGELPIFG
jgi:hypothetical protein